VGLVHLADHRNHPGVHRVCLAWIPGLDDAGLRDVLAIGIGGLVTEPTSRLEELILVAPRRFANNQQPLKALLFCIACEPTEHLFDLIATIWNLSVELLAELLHWIGMIGMEVQLVLAHVDADNKQIIGVNFAFYGAYVNLSRGLN